MDKMTPQQMRELDAFCAGILGIQTKLRRFKHKCGAMLYVCPKCQSESIEIWDCGYSSFNVGGIKCKTCGHEIDNIQCGFNPEKELAKRWNAYCKPSIPSFTASPADASLVRKKCLHKLCLVGRTVEIWTDTDGSYYISMGLIEVSAETEELAWCLFAKAFFGKAD